MNSHEASEGKRNSEQLSSYLMVSTQSFIIPEIKITIILPGGKYIVIHHSSANIAQYSAQAQEVIFSDEKYTSI